MDKTRAIISANLERHTHFEEYFRIIDVIEEHTRDNPDICIESCKALIEGVSKTILISLDNTKTTDNIDKDDLPKLFKEAMRKLSDKCEDLEGDFTARFSSIIQSIGEIRNKRSDISHGRMAPKFIFSSSKLASTIVYMTDCMLEYILEHYFSINLLSNGLLLYDSDEMKAYNTWLDDSIEFPIKKAIYSKLLFENDYDEYESRYSDEFLKFKEDEEIEIVEVEPEKIIEAKSAPNSELEIEAIERIVAVFDEERFWTESKIQSLQDFAEAEDLKIGELKEIINKYLFSEKTPLRNDVLKAMNNKPKLIEFKILGPKLTNKILSFVNKLNISAVRP